MCVFILLKTHDGDKMSTCFGKGNRHMMCACVRSVHPVEHSSVWGEAVGAGFTQGRHRALRPVRVQWLQTGEKRFLMEHEVKECNGPFQTDLSTLVQVQVPRGRLFAFDSEGQHILTCSNTGGLIYRVNTPFSLPSSLLIICTQHVVCCLNTVYVFLRSSVVMCVKFLTMMICFLIVSLC